jgi:hypothetical protein
VATGVRGEGGWCRSELGERPKTGSGGQAVEAAYVEEASVGGRCGEGRWHKLTRVATSGWCGTGSTGLQAGGVRHVGGDDSSNGGRQCAGGSRSRRQAVACQHGERSAGAATWL